MKKLLVVLVALLLLGGLTVTIIEALIAAHEVGRRVECTNKIKIYTGGYIEHSPDALMGDSATRTRP